MDSGYIDQVFGSSNFMDITGDSTDDVFINSRSGLLKAINGKTGKDIWNFIDGDSWDARENGWYNFYNIQFIKYLNNDGYGDILVSNGGDVLKEPYDPDRPQGVR